MIPKVPGLQTHPIEREASLHDLPANEHPSVKSNQEAEKKRQEALGRLRDAANLLRANAPVAWNQLEGELVRLRDLSSLLAARSPYEFLGERIPADYFPLCIAHAQGQKEILDTLFASLDLKAADYSAPKGNTKPIRTPGAKNFFAILLAFLRKCGIRPARSEV